MAAHCRPEPKAHEVESDRYRYIAAAIDFIYQTGEDALRQHTRRLLDLNRKDTHGEK